MRCTKQYDFPQDRLHFEEEVDKRFPKNNLVVLHVYSGELLIKLHSMFLLILECNFVCDFWQVM